MKRGKKMLKYKEIMGWVDCVCYEKKKKNYFLKHQTKQKIIKKNIFRKGRAIKQIYIYRKSQKVLLINLLLWYCLR